MCVKVFKKIFVICVIFFCILCFILHTFPLYPLNFNLSKDYSSPTVDLYQLQLFNEVLPPLNLKIVPGVDNYTNVINKSDESALNIISAFFDPRLSKIIVIYHPYYKNKISIYNTLNNFSFRLFFNSGFSPMEIKGRFDGYPYPFFYCFLPNDTSEIPTYISLSSTRENGSFSTDKFPVINLLERKNTIEPKGFVMCVGILFGYQNWLTLLQYIEYHRMQGVEKFILFYNDLYWSTEIILSWYLKNTDYVEMVRWNFSSTFCFYPYNCQYHRDMHCMYSLMYRYKYVGFSDIDELYFSINKTLIEFLKEIDSPDLGSFTFSTKYHLTQSNDIPDWPTVGFDNISKIVNNYIPLYYYKTLLIPSYLFYAPKTIYKPETVIAGTSHNIFIHVNSSRQRYDVNSSRGFFRHFKIKSEWKLWIPDGNVSDVNPFVEIGETILRNLSSNVVGVVKAINGWN